MKVQEYYTIRKTDEMVVYGAGALGKGMALKLQQEGWNVVACFDQNANNIIKDISIPIYTLEEGIGRLGNRIIVIICIHDAHLHAGIADNIYFAGINKIIFIPAGSHFVSEYGMQMLKVYTCFFENNINAIEVIPYYADMIRNRWQKSVIRETEDIVVAWCSIEILYVGCELLESEKKKGLDLDRYADLPVMAYRMMIDAYKYFQEGTSSIEEFVGSYRLRESANPDEKEFLRRRYKVFLMLENEWKTNQRYFEYAPVDVKWNEKGYFNIIDGHNRAVYLSLKGITWIPVRMSQVDYIAWENSVVAKKVIQKLKCEKLDVFMTPIPHPYFMYEKFQKENNGLEILSAFQYYLGVDIRNIKTVIEVSSYEGYFSRNFIRSGVSEAVIIESNEKIRERISEIQKLLQLRTILIKDDLTDCDNDMNVDIAFIVAGMGSGELRYSFQNTVLKTSKMVMWESYRNPVEEKQAILESGYGSYVLLLKKCYGDRVSEVGVFVRSW